MLEESIVGKTQSLQRVAPSVPVCVPNYERERHIIIAHRVRMARSGKGSTFGMVSSQYEFSSDFCSMKSAVIGFSGASLQLEDTQQDLPSSRPSP